MPKAKRNERGRTAHQGKVKMAKRNAARFNAETLIAKAIQLGANPQHVKTKRAAEYFLKYIAECERCGESGCGEKDHYVPVGGANRGAGDAYKNGLTALDNIRLLCKKCNWLKQKKFDEKLHVSIYEILNSPGPKAKKMKKRIDAHKKAVDKWMKM